MALLQRLKSLLCKSIFKRFISIVLISKEEPIKIIKPWQNTGHYLQKS